MARPLRIEYPGAWYHVMNRGLARSNIFETDDHRETFVGLFADLYKRFAIEIHAYCLMGNHYHLLVHTPRGNLSRGMRHLNGLFTQYMNRLLRRDGPLMRGRYKSVLVEDDVYLLHVSRYIHLNPVGPGLVERAEDYRWSSCRHYLQGSWAPEGVFSGPVLSLLGDDVVKARKRYANYLASGVDEATEAFYAAKKMKPVMGGDDFVEKIRSELSNNREVADRKLLGSKLPIVEVIGRMAGKQGLTREALLLRENKYQRNIVMLGCRNLGYAQREIAEALNLGNYSAVSSALRRMSESDVLAVDALMESLTRDET